MATDLTFQQLLTALPAGSIVALASGDPAPATGVYIRVGAVTGDSITTLSSAGVIELMVKILKGAVAAQTTLNVAEPAGSRLNAFPPPDTRAPTLNPTTGLFESQITYSVRGLAVASIDTITGPLA